MTPFQQKALVAWSIFATVAVLVIGGGVFDTDGVDLDAVANKQIVLNVPGSSDTAANEPADAGASGADSTTGDDTSTPDEQASSDEPVGGDESYDQQKASAPEDETPKPSKVKHVFVITLAGRGFDATFGPGSPAAYLNGQLRPQGALLEGYRSLGQADLPDYIAMLGGQPPNDDTRAGCPVFKEIGSSATPSKSGEIAGPGCVYPNTVTTLADQLSASRRTWRAYVEDIGKGPRGAILCRRPESNAADDTLKARPGDGYATRHNPFVYFHSLLDLSDCDQSDGPLERLDQDLAAVKSTPNLSYIVPNLCNDGTESPCLDGRPGGLVTADAFLAQWVPKILASPAYKEDGLLIVTFAGNVAPAPDVRNGALLVSPFAQAGTAVASEYDSYSLLRSMQDLFGVKPLARAAKASSFADTVLSEALTTSPSDD